MKLSKYIKVKIGEYEKNGETKGKYATVGRVLVDDEGNEMVLLDRTFNPAGVPSDRESIILNFWDAEEKKEALPAQTKPARPPLDDEIPF